MSMMGQAVLLQPHGLHPRLRSQQGFRSGCRRPCLGRGVQVQLRASGDAERPTPQQQPQQEEDAGLSGRRLLLLAGASAVASAVPAWLSMAKNRGRAGAATLADQQVRHTALSIIWRRLLPSPAICMLCVVPFPKQVSAELHVLIGYQCWRSAGDRCCMMYQWTAYALVCCEPASAD